MQNPWRLVITRYCWILAAVTAFTLTIIRWCPTTQVRPNEVMGEVSSILRVPGMLEQLHDPAVSLSGSWRFATYFYVATRWRLLPPTVGHLLHLSPQAYLLLPRVGAVLTLLLGAWYAWRLGGAQGAWAAALTLASSAAWLVTVDRVEFDSWAWVFLLLAAFTPNAVGAWAAVVLGAWVDERFIFFLPVALLIRWRITGSNPWRLVSGLAPYALIRIAALAMGDSGMGAQLGLVTRGWSLGWCLLGWFVGWRGACPVLAYGLRKTQPPGSFSCLTAAALGGVLLAAALAVDYTRASAGLAPLAVFGAGRMNLLPPRWRVMIWAPLLANWVLPYAQLYWNTWVPMPSIFSPPSSNWVCPIN